MRGLLCLILLTAQVVLGLGDDKCIFFPEAHPSSLSTWTTISASLSSTLQTILGKRTTTDLDTPFIISSSDKHLKTITPILVDSHDDEAIHVAAHFFAGDIERVTGLKPQVFVDEVPRGVNSERVIVVGSIGSELVRKWDEGWMGGMQRRWEVWDARVVKGVKTGVKEALVLSGSDRRGAIYALYTLSEQMGTSPWYWWADVPTTSHPTIAFDSSKVCGHGEPTIKYRGLFINDELPVLWNWARDTFEIPLSESPFQVGMYERVFELLLRLRANYAWPAMWAGMFDVDGLNPQANGLPTDPTPGPNQKLAGRMGIVMGTSHHEPMARNKAEWDLEGRGPWDWTNNKTLTEWWEYGAKRASGQETMYTLGMRGDGDRPLTGASKELLEEITGVQRDLLKKVYNSTDISHIPQMWCMYKEVQGYFQNGLNVPDDVTIMLADDNWGNIMAVPPKLDHKAGAGLYYHVDYVGVPRDYKWINTISLAKMWDQLNIAKTFGMDQVWILNVGDLKLVEIPLDYFLSIAYDSDQWGHNSVTPWLRAWAARDFGEEFSEEVADVMGVYSRYASRIKPELLNSTLWSMTNYEEAERVIEEWTELENRSDELFHAMTKSVRTAYFELVHSAIMLMANLNRLYVAVGKNNMYADQARTSTNLWADKAVEYFKKDSEITQMYHELYDGRWNHMLDQTHINWNWFLEPQRNTMPPVNYIETNLPARPSREGSPPGLPAYYRVSVENSRGAWPGISKYNCGEHKWDCWSPILLPLDPFGAKSRWVEISSGGPKDITFTVGANVSWINTTISHGKIKKDGSDDVRFHVSVDWTKVSVKEEGYTMGGGVFIAGSDQTNVTVKVPIIVPPKDGFPSDDYRGFIEGDGYVVMEARHFVENTSVEEYAWQEHGWYGRTISGLSILPISDHNFTIGQGPSLSYDFWTTGARFHEHKGKVRVTIQIAPGFNFLLGKKVAFGLSLDNGAPRTFTPIPESVDLPDAGTVFPNWANVVSNEIRNVTEWFDLIEEGGDEGGLGGKHRLTIWGMSAGIMIERIWIDMGGIAERGYSYLGPPESIRV